MGSAHRRSILLDMAGASRKGASSAVASSASSANAPACGTSHEGSRRTNGPGIGKRKDELEISPENNTGLF